MSDANRRGSDLPCVSCGDDTDVHYDRLWDEPKYALCGSCQIFGYYVDVEAKRLMKMEPTVVRALDDTKDLVSAKLKARREAREATGEQG